MSQKDNIHLMLLRDIRRPEVVDLDDISAETLDTHIVSIGSYSSSENFNIYYYIYKDLLGRINVAAFEITSYRDVERNTDSLSALSIAIKLSRDKLEETNKALTAFGLQPMTLKVMLSTATL